MDSVSHAPPGGDDDDLFVGPPSVAQALARSRFRVRFGVTIAGSVLSGSGVPRGYQEITKLGRVRFVCLKARPAGDGVSGVTGCKEECQEEVSRSRYHARSVTVLDHRSGSRVSPRRSRQTPQAQASTCESRSTKR